MLLWISIALALLVGGLVVRPISSRAELHRLTRGILPTLGIAVLGLVISLLAVLQGDPFAKRELVSSQEISSLEFSESSTKRGELIGNYSYSYEQRDERGRSYLAAGSVPSDATRLYIQKGMQSTRIERYQGYWSDPLIFPFPVPGYETYEIHAAEDPR